SFGGGFHGGPELLQPLVVFPDGIFVLGQPALVASKSLLSVFIVQGSPPVRHCSTVDQANWYRAIEPFYSISTADEKVSSRTPGGRGLDHKGRSQKSGVKKRADRTAGNRHRTA